MPSIEWRHDRQRLILPVVILTPPTAPNPNLSLRTTALLDTGATSTGIREDVAAGLNLPARGQRRIQTASEMIMCTEHLFRIGFIVGDHGDPAFLPDVQQPYVIDKRVVGFSLRSTFSYPILLGMDVIGAGDLTLTRDGRARLELP